LRKKAQALERAEIVRLAKERRGRVHSLLQLSPRQFEKAIAELYEALGFNAILTPPSNDEGRDVIAENGNQTLYIECKRYAAGNLVGRPALQKLVGAIPDGRIVGVFVTTSGFSSPATKYAKERGVTLIDGLQLDAMLRETFPNLEQEETVLVACPECGIPVRFPLTAVGTEQACANWHIVTNTFEPRKVDALLGRRTEQACDRCGSEMVLRKGRRGKFWGCAEYPSCRFTRPFRANPTKE
jgi:restriction system protein